MFSFLCVSGGEEFSAGVNVTEWNWSEQAVNRSEAVAIELDIKNG